jgi:hypothetical protein
MRRLYYTIAIILLGSMFLVYGQEEKMDKFPRNLYWGGLSNEDFFNQSDYIFEGKLVSQKIYHNEDTSNVWTSMLIEVIYILKGGNEIQKGEIEIIKNSGNVLVGYDENGVMILIEHHTDLDFRPPEHGIFFCKKNNLSFRPASNNPSVEVLDNSRNAGLNYRPILSYRNFVLFGLNNLYFKNMEEFYDYAEQFEGITTPEQQKKNIRTQGYNVPYYNPKLEQFMEQQWALYNNVIENKMILNFY